jgi:hypothetical protein
LITLVLQFDAYAETKEVHVPQGLYRGNWPQNVSKLAKYTVRFIDGEWKVTVLYDAGDGLRFLAVDGGGAAIAKMVNAAKSAARDQPGGAFYINEFRHVIVPVAAPKGDSTGSHYYYAGRLQGDLSFEFEEQMLSTRPVGQDGRPLKPGDRWIGPRPGIPYVLAAAGNDIYYKVPALTDTDPPAVRPNMTRQVHLSKAIGSTIEAAQTARTISAVRVAGGRFYVNEHGAIFTPVGSSESGIDYIYCGTLEYARWFPEPAVASP